MFTMTPSHTVSLLSAGGCNDAVRPADVLTCVPVCTPLNSKCVDSNLCSCVPPYRPVYSPNNTLTDCVMNTTTTPAAGGTTDVQPGVCRVLMMQNESRFSDKLILEQTYLQVAL